MKKNMPCGQNLNELRECAATARRTMVDVLVQSGCGHPGGAFSCVDLLVALYFNIMQFDPENPEWDGRDRFILSKGHASVALYTVLHMTGFWDLDKLMTFRQNDSPLCGHPDRRKAPGIEMNTGSLGHGLSIGIGLALAAKLDRKNYRTIVLMGDGETQEGSVWEAAMAAGHYQLDNLIGIVDRNKLQIDGSTETVMNLEPYQQKWESFGWAVEPVDGHDINAIIDLFLQIPFQPSRPSLIIANTIKGKGVSFMENCAEWHGKALCGEFADMAKREMLDYCKDPE